MFPYCADCLGMGLGVNLLTPFFLKKNMFQYKSSHCTDSLPSGKIVTVSPQIGLDMKSTIWSTLAWILNFYFISLQFCAI